MPRLLLFCCCLIFTVSAFSRPATDTANYLDYFRRIATAEKAVTVGRYQEALQDYRQAFNDFSWNNPADCYVAAQVAAYTEDTLTTKQLLYRGLCFGLHPQTIGDNPHLRVIARQMDTMRMDSCRQVYQSHVNSSARAAIITLVRYDQYLIRHTQPYKIRGDHDLKPQYRPVWDSLVREIIALTGRYGFPAEKIAGTQQGDDSLFRVAPHAIFAHPIFIHQAHAWLQISALLTEQLKLGNITPQAYGLIYEVSNSVHNSYDLPIPYFAIRPCQDTRCKKWMKRRLPEIDRVRNEIGLCSYEVMEHKFADHLLYEAWRRQPQPPRIPVFDFQCELAFQGQN